MKLDFGHLQEYYLKQGYGFVSRTLKSSRQSTQKVFFHIRTIKKKYPDLAQELDNGLRHNISFWYESESSDKGEQVCNVWLDVKDVPLSLTKLEELILEKTKLMGINYKLLEELSFKAKEIFLISSDLRKLLNSNGHCKFINENLGLVDESLKQELIDELLQRVEKADNSLRSEYWKQADYLRENLKYKGDLWNIAPPTLKVAIIKQQYSKFFNSISRFNELEYPSKSLSFDWKAIYNFSNLDKTLVEKWHPDSKKETFKSAQMISARGAEKLVIEFYKSLGYLVEDISIHQITHETEIWRKGDIRLNSGKLLDVKNARTSVNSKSYAEFCIPSFKKERGGDVKIVAVLSPYLQEEYMNGTAQPNFPVENPKVLGEVNKTEFSNLETLFSDRLLSIDIVRDLDPKTYLPPWLFDYCKRFYVKRIETIADFQQLDDTEIPDWEDIVVAKVQSFSAFIASKRQLPTRWIEHVPKWKVDFINSLINLPVDHISLPYLFLSLLKHFLTMLSHDDSEYAPYQYQELLYSDCEFPGCPLKIYDPLGLVKEFCNSLQTLWEYRNQVNLSNFKIFRFTGKGLLQGKKSQQGPLITLLAYCGGWIESKGKCGYKPLIIGKDRSCTCGYLICPKENCQFCSKNCEEYQKRNQNNLIKNKYTYSLDDQF